MKFKSEIVTQASGSIGGTTYAHNRGGMYRRARSIPTNPNSIRQQAVRAGLSAAVSNWNSVLTSAQRAAWAAYALNTPKTDTLGDELVLTGQQAYIGSSVIRIQAGVSPVAVAPTSFNTGENITEISTVNNDIPNVLGVEATALSVALTLSAAASDDGELLVYMSPPLSPARNFWKGPYQLAYRADLAAAATFISLTALLNTSTATTQVALGEIRAYRFVLIYDDGRTSTPFDAILTATDDTL